MDEGINGGSRGISLRDKIVEYLLVVREPGDTLGSRMEEDDG